jgi:hypothetical protein
MTVSRICGGCAIEKLADPVFLCAADVLGAREKYGRLSAYARGCGSARTPPHEQLGKEASIP